jgi:hypothetical protein
MRPDVAAVTWRPCYRIIPSRFPPVGLYDRVADAADLDAVFAVENLTNPRLRHEAGDISLVPPVDRISGEGATPIMAAFTFLNPEGSRFSDGSYGVYYAGRSLDTSLAESRHHRERFLSRTQEDPIELDMRCYLAQLSGELHDVRGRTDITGLYDPDDYAVGQVLGRELKALEAWGVVYDSVRDPGGQCVGVFRPPILSACIQGPHFGYRWDGKRITGIVEKRMVKTY